MAWTTTYGTIGRDWLEGTQAGEEALYGFDEDDVLLGGPGYDLLSGGAGNDVVMGQGLLYGDAGNDWVQMTGGATNFLYGGDGDDTVVVLAFGTGSAMNRGDGGAGNDVLVCWGTSNGDGVALFGGSGNDWIQGGVANDALRGGTEDDTLIGDDGQDHMEGEEGDDLMFGGRDMDAMAGGAGADWLLPGTGRDTLDLGEANGAGDRVSFFSALELSEGDTVGRFVVGQDRVDVAVLLADLEARSGLDYYGGNNSLLRISGNTVEVWAALYNEDYTVRDGEFDWRNVVTLDTGITTADLMLL